jgi:hypothetical protein
VMWLNRLFVEMRAHISVPETAVPGGADSGE